MKLDKQIYNRGKITIASRLSQEYYDYSAGFETLAFNRISEALCGIGEEGTLITLSSITPVGGEVTANKIWQWLVINVVATTSLYEDKAEFGKFLEAVAFKAMDKLVAATKYKAALETGDDYTVITNND